MKLSHLLRQREKLLRQAHLANLAYAYRRLGGYAARIARAQLVGEVRLRFCDPEAECFWPVLTSLERSQAVIEEHFTDEDIADLAELLAFATDDSESDQVFRLEELAERFMRPLQRELEQGGVTLEPSARPLEETSRGEPA